MLQSLFKYLPGRKGLGPGAGAALSTAPGEEAGAAGWRCWEPAQVCAGETPEGPKEQGQEKRVKDSNRLFKFHSAYILADFPMKISITHLQTVPPSHTQLRITKYMAGQQSQKPKES